MGIRSKRNTTLSAKARRFSRHVREVNQHLHWSPFGCEDGRKRHGLTPYTRQRSEGTVSESLKVFKKCTCDGCCHPDQWCLAFYGHKCKRIVQNLTAQFSHPLCGYCPSKKVLWLTVRLWPMVIRSKRNTTLSAKARRFLRHVREVSQHLH